MNHTQRWLARVRPRHNPAENALIANMRDDPHIPWLNSLAACATTPANAGRRTQAYNRSLRAYGSGTDAGTTLTRSDKARTANCRRRR
jgi:hypothetical protein